MSLALTALQPKAWLPTPVGNYFRLCTTVWVLKVSTCHLMRRCRMDFIQSLHLVGRLSEFTSTEMASLTVQDIAINCTEPSVPKTCSKYLGAGVRADPTSLAMRRWLPETSSLKLPDAAIKNLNICGSLHSRSSRSARFTLGRDDSGLSCALNSDRCWGGLN